MHGYRLWTFAVAGILAWLLTLLFGGWGPLFAGLAAGRFAPRRGAFWLGALGALAAWVLWFLAAMATSPLLPLARLLGRIVGLGAGAGLALPLLAAILAGVVSGIGCTAGQALFAAAHPEPAASVASTR